MASGILFALAIGALALMSVVFAAPEFVERLTLIIARIGSRSATAAPAAAPAPASGMAPDTEAIAVCPDATVLGRPFYLMGFVDGWSPMDGKGWPEPFRDRRERPTRRSAPS